VKASIPQILKFMASSFMTMWRTDNFSAALVFPAPKNDLAYQKYDNHTTQKSPPRGVQFYFFETF